MNVMIQYIRILRMYTCICACLCSCACVYAQLYAGYKGAGMLSCGGGGVGLSVGTKGLNKIKRSKLTRFHHLPSCADKVCACGVCVARVSVCVVYTYVCMYVCMYEQGKRSKLICMYVCMYVYRCPNIDVAR